jgi:hypothetical protein
MEERQEQRRCSLLGEAGLSSGAMLPVIGHSLPIEKKDRRWAATLL